MKKLLVILLLLFPVSCSEKEKVSKAIENCADKGFLEAAYERGDLDNTRLEGNLKNKLQRKSYLKAHYVCEKEYSEFPETFMKRWGD